MTRAESPYDDPEWEPLIVWALGDIESQWHLHTEMEAHEFPDLAPLPSEVQFDVRLTYLQYAAAVMGSAITVDVGDDYPDETIVVALPVVMALRHLGFDPVFGVEEWAGWRENRPGQAPHVAHLS
jgi:hypothetical protein